MAMKFSIKLLINFPWNFLIFHKLFPVFCEICGHPVLTICAEQFVFMGWVSGPQWPQPHQWDQHMALCIEAPAAAWPELHQWKYDMLTWPEPNYIGGCFRHMEETWDRHRVVSLRENEPANTFAASGLTTSPGEVVTPLAASVWRLHLSEAPSNVV